MEREGRITILDGKLLPNPIKRNLYMYYKWQEKFNHLMSFGCRGIKTLTNQ